MNYKSGAGAHYRGKAALVSSSSSRKCSVFHPAVERVIGKRVSIDRRRASISIPLQVWKVSLVKLPLPSSLTSARMLRPNQACREPCQKQHSVREARRSPTERGMRPVECRPLRNKIDSPHGSTGRRTLKQPMPSKTDEPTCSTSAVETEVEPHQRLMQTRPST